MWPLQAWQLKIYTCRIKRDCFFVFFLLRKETFFVRHVGKIVYTQVKIMYFHYRSDYSWFSCYHWNSFVPHVCGKNRAVSIPVLLHFDVRYRKDQNNNNNNSILQNRIRFIRLIESMTKRNKTIRNMPVWGGPRTQGLYSSNTLPKTTCPEVIHHLALINSAPCNIFTSITLKSEGKKNGLEWYKDIACVEKFISFMRTSVEVRH